MPAAVPTLLIAAATTVVVGVVTDDGWPGFVVGAVLSLALWMMLFAGTWAQPGGLQWVRVRDFLLASVLSLLLGGAIFLASDDNAAFWAVGFIVGGVLLPSASAAVRRGEQA